jgi:hypothetical protein
MLQQDATSGKWYLACTSQTNPVVVDGKLVKQSAWLAEGSEMLIGADHLLVFCENDQKASNYFGSGRARFEKKTCGRCDWAGMVSALRNDPECPKCGAKGLQGGDNYVPEKPKFVELEPDSTRAIDLDQMRAGLKNLKTAKQSHVERMDGFTGQGVTRKDLKESESLTLGRGEDLHLQGFVFGRVTIAWNGRRYMISDRLLWGSLKVNGEACKETALKHGDVIEVGANRFKVVTE